MYAQSVTEYCCVIMKLQASALPGVVQLGGREEKSVPGRMCRPVCMCVSGGDRGVSLSRRIWAVWEWRGMRPNPAASPCHPYPTGGRPVGGVHTPTHVPWESPQLFPLHSPYTLPPPPPLPPALVLNTSVCRIWFHSAPDQGPWQLTAGQYKPPNGSHSVMIYTALLYTPAATSSW